MARQGVDILMQRLKADRAFRDKVLALPDLDGRMAFMHTEGYDCTAQEIANELERLDDTTLDAVAGGGGGGLADSLISEGCQPDFNVICT